MHGVHDCREKLTHKFELDDMCVVTDRCRVFAQHALAKFKANLPEHRQSLSSLVALEQHRQELDSDETLLVASKSTSSRVKKKRGCYMSLARRCKALSKTVAFQAFIIIVILCAGIFDGANCYESVSSLKDIRKADHLFLALFTCEAVVKIIAKGYHPWHYFTDSDDGTWNCFDFIIVTAGLLDLFGMGAGIEFLRLLRVIRVLRVLKFWSELQTIINGLIGGIKASIAIVFLIFFVFFLYGTIGTNLFGRNDPEHFGSLGQSMTSLYLVSTGVASCGALALCSLFLISSFFYCVSPVAACVVLDFKLRMA
jgi:hypothetical protein